MNMEAALAHCPRDANGLLKLGGLWLHAKHAHNSLSKLVRRHALEVTVVKGWVKKRGIYAQESVARKLAQLIPAQHLWQDGGSETNGEPTPAVTPEAVAHPNPATNPAGVQVSEDQLLITDLLSESDVSTHLSYLLQRPISFKLRITPNKELALIDVAILFTGLDNNKAGLAVRRLLAQFPDVQSNRLNFKFPGRGQKEVEVAPPGAVSRFSIKQIEIQIPGQRKSHTCWNVL